MASPLFSHWESGPSLGIYPFWAIWRPFSSDEGLNHDVICEQKESEICGDEFASEIESVILKQKNFSLRTAEYNSCASPISYRVAS